jgi:ATPase subunit of ABC transporter with duplicated ATPase domains
VDLVVLDEPTNQFDVEGVRWLADGERRRPSTAGRSAACRSCSLIG